MRIKEQETRLTLQEHDDDDDDDDEFLTRHANISSIRTILDLIQTNYYYYLLQLGCHPVAVVILHVHKTLNCLLINLSREGYMRSM